MKKEEFLRVFQESVQPKHEKEISRTKKAINSEMNVYIKTAILSVFAWFCLTITIGTWAYVVIPFAIYFIYLLFFKLAEHQSKKAGISMKETLSSSNRVKEGFYKDCLSYFGPSLQYSAENSLSEADFKKYGIIQKEYMDKFKSSDQIEGEIQGRHYRSNQLDIRYEYTDAEGETQQEIVFKGFMVETPISIDPSFTLTSYQGRTNYAVPKPSIFQPKSSGLSPLSFSHYQFDSLFKSATNNPILAQSFLDPAQLDALVEKIKQELPHAHFAISKGTFILLIPHKSSFDLYGSKHIDGEVVWNELSKLYQYASFIEHLELDERASEVSVG